MGEWYLQTEPRSDWLTDPLQPEKLTFSQLLNARDGADRTGRPTMHFGITPRKVNEIRQRTDAVGKGVQAYPPPARCRPPQAAGSSDSVESDSVRTIAMFRLYTILISTLRVGIILLCLISKHLFCIT